MKLNTLLGAALIVSCMAGPAIAADAPAVSDEQATANLMQHMKDAKALWDDVKGLPSRAKEGAKKMDAAAKAKLDAKFAKVRARVQKVKDWEHGMEAKYADEKAKAKGKLAEGKAEMHAAKLLAVKSLIKKAEDKLNSLDPDGAKAAPADKK